MKRIILSLIILSSLAACEVVELDSPSGSNGNTLENEKIPNIGLQVANENEAVLSIADSSSKTWAAAQFTLGGSESLTSCRLDDQMIFFKNGTYDYSSGRELCGAEDNKRNRVGTWRIDFEGEKMVFDEGTPNQYIAEIIGLTQKELRLKGSYFNLEVRGRYTAQ